MKLPMKDLAFAKFNKIKTSQDWFSVYEVAPNLFVFYEPNHVEQTLVNLIIGEGKAVLIDTGCGIGNLRKAVKEITDKPITVINTHTHPDHLGSNNQFDEIAMFDHPLSRKISENGVSQQVLKYEILDESLFTGPLPEDFDPQAFAIEPFPVKQWLKEGDLFETEGFSLEVIHTPGEATNHISLLDRANRRLFCGDILLEGEVWTHLEGGSLEDLLMSYQKLMDIIDDFDYLMPSHNGTMIEKSLLPESIRAAERVLSGQSDFQEVIDHWNRRIKKHTFERFSITTR